MKITITANDGKLFHGEDFYKLEKEVIAYEDSLKAKEEVKRAKEKEEIKAFEEIKKEIQNLETMIKEFRLATGKMVYVHNCKDGIAVTRDYLPETFFRLID